MLILLVLQAVILIVSSELYIPHVEYLKEYAPTYHNYKPRDYEFNYGVSDPFTGDHKSQWEVKQNGVVRGGYSLLEPDGTTRLVEYIADDGGFRAVVNKLGTAVHPVAPLVPQYSTYSGQYNNYYAQQQVPIVPQVHSLPVSTKSVISPVVPEYNSYQQGLIAQEVPIVPQLQTQFQPINQQILPSAVPQYEIAQQFPASPQTVNYVLPELELKGGVSVPQAAGLNPYRVGQHVLSSPNVVAVPHAGGLNSYAVEQQVLSSPNVVTAPQTVDLNSYQHVLSSPNDAPVPHAVGLNSYTVGQHVLSSPNVVPGPQAVGLNSYSVGQQVPNVVQYDKVISQPLPRPISSSVDATYTPTYSHPGPSNGISAISPSYITNIQYDGYSGAYSHEVPNLIPAPITKRTANLKPAPPAGPQGKFLIYVPESESD